MLNSDIEILAPCGSFDILKTAIKAGADACYIGGSRFGARAYADNLSDDQLESAIDYAHIHGKKLYLTVNTLIKESELSSAYEYIKDCYEAGIDAFIVQDLGLFKLIRDNFSDVHIHCSTQMNITSYHAAAYMKKMGASRIVTAREMPLSEIKLIKDKVDVEVETFVHGAMCYSYSGQCLMSSLAGGRSGNRGRCAQPCRKCYDGDYILSMKDMCALELIPKLAKAGIDSFKIEGRMKSAEYVGTVVSAYRYVIDHYKEDRKGAIATGKRILASDFARSKTTYWYGFNSLEDGVQNAAEKILNPDQAGGTGIYLGKISATKAAPKELLQAYRDSLGADAEGAAGIQMAVLKGGNYDPDPGRGYYPAYKGRNPDRYPDPAAGQGRSFQTEQEHPGRPLCDAGRTGSSEA